MGVWLGVLPSPSSTGALHSTCLALAAPEPVRFCPGGVPGIMPAQVGSSALCLTRCGHPASLHGVGGLLVADGRMDACMHGLRGWGHGRRSSTAAGGAWRSRRARRREGGQESRMQADGRPHHMSHFVPEPVGPFCPGRVPGIMWCACCVPPGRVSCQYDTLWPSWLVLPSQPTRGLLHPTAHKGQPCLPARQPGFVRGACSLSSSAPGWCHWRRHEGRSWRGLRCI